VRNAIEVIAYTFFPVVGHGEGGLAPPRAILVHMHAVTSIDSSAVHTRVSNPNPGPYPSPNPNLLAP
jgi:hypothetical protein